MSIFLCRCVFFFPADIPMGNQLLVQWKLCFVEGPSAFTGIQVLKEMTSVRRTNWRWVFQIFKNIDKSCWSRSHCNYSYSYSYMFVWNCLSSRRIKLVVFHKLWTWERLPSTRICTRTVLTWVLKWRSMAQVGWLNARYGPLSIGSSSWWAVICMFAVIQGSSLKAGGRPPSVAASEP